MLEAQPDRSRVFRTLHTAQGVATFRRTLDMRDDHPAKKLLTGLCAVGVLTPHNLGLTRLHVPDGKTGCCRKPLGSDYLFRTRNALTNAARLVRIAATPIKNKPSILPIADSFPAAYVLFLFLNGKG